MESSENSSIDNHIIMDGNISGGSSSVPLNSRWNPTKEQISILENLYKQGIRTPTADQIQQITSRLRAFGHIEGKNVFYWFQNHKARQRQKQKQERLAYIHQLYHSKDYHYQPAIFSPSPWTLPEYGLQPMLHVPQSKIGFYQEYHKVILPMAGFKRRSMNQKMCTTINFPALPEENNSVDHRIINQETLPLFPLHPTGNLQGREKPMFSLDSSTPNDTSDTTFENAPNNYELGFFL